MLTKLRTNQIYVQGDQAACPKPPVDIDVKVACQYKDLLLKTQLQINVNGSFWTSCLVAL